MLWPVLNRFIDICLLRKTPADLPASSVLAALTTVAFLLLSGASEWLGQEARYFPERPLISLIGSFLMVAAVVICCGHRARLKQTWIAFTGCGVLISLPVFTLALSVSAGTGLPAGGFPLTALAMTFLLVWSIVVDAHIYRHAVGIGLSAGLAIAVLTYALLLVVRSILFP